MGEATLDRKEFIGRIGVFFLLSGLFSLLIFISTDISRSQKNLSARQTNTAYAILALQTRDAGALTAIQQSLPTPTLEHKDIAATQEYIVYGVQALQTRDTGAKTAIANKTATPTMIDPNDLKQKSGGVGYLIFLCFGAIAAGAGLVILRMTAPPPKPAGRFEWLRKLRQKQRESKEKREAAKKEKEAKKKK